MILGPNRTHRSLLVFLTAVSGIFLWRFVAAQQTVNHPFVPLSTSINWLMVALVDHAAHEVWDASYAEDLTDQDWLTVEQHAIQLVASGTLVSLGGTGPADGGWVVAPAWQQHSQTLTDAALAALAASEAHDQQALTAAGATLVDACESCHELFKPDSPTEGVTHIPHYSE